MTEIAIKSRQTEILHCQTRSAFYIKADTKRVKALVTAEAEGRRRCNYLIVSDTSNYWRYGHGIGSQALSSELDNRQARYESGEFGKHLVSYPKHTLGTQLDIRLQALRFRMQVSDD